MKGLILPILSIRILLFRRRYVLEVGLKLSVAGGRSDWTKFREMLPLLTMRGISLCAQGSLDAACVKSVMLFGNKTWAIKEEDICRLKPTEITMIRWMRSVFEC